VQVLAQFQQSHQEQQQFYLLEQYQHLLLWGNINQQYALRQAQTLGTLLVELHNA
jgi:hypothetical protein